MELREQAIEIAKRAAKAFPPSYYTGEDFEPHEWVVVAVADALNQKRQSPSPYVERFGCKRCKSEHVSGELTKLIGGYSTRLCIDCLNAWSVYVRTEVPQFVEHNRKNAELAHAVENRTPEYVARVADEIFALDVALFAVAKRWVEGGG